jgi:hypothetical protein
MEYHSEDMFPRMLSCCPGLHEILRLWAIKLHLEGYSLCTSRINFVVRYRSCVEKSVLDRLDANNILVYQKLCLAKLFNYRSSELLVRV